MPFFRKVLFFWPETALRRRTPRATARIAAQAAQSSPVWHGVRRLSESMAHADFFAPFPAPPQPALLQPRVSALRLSGTLAAVTHRKSNRPFTPAKQNAAKPPARRIFRRAFRPPGKIRLKPTKPDACRQAEPSPPLRLRRPLSDGNPGAALVASRRRSRDRTAVRTSSVRSLLRPQARVRFRAHSPIVRTGRRRHTRSAECRRQKCWAGFCVIRPRPRGAVQSG